MTDYLYYCFKGEGGVKSYEGRYWNCQGTNIAVVATVTEGIDWAAYIGAEAHSSSEQEALKYIANYGSKLSKEDAQYFFPDIELPYRA